MAFRLDYCFLGCSWPFPSACLFFRFLVPIVVRDDPCGPFFSHDPIRIAWLGRGLQRCQLMGWSWQSAAELASWNTAVLESVVRLACLHPTPPPSAMRIYLDPHVSFLARWQHPPYIWCPKQAWRPKQTVRPCDGHQPLHLTTHRPSTDIRWHAQLSVV